MAQYLIRNGQNNIYNLYDDGSPGVNNFRLTIDAPQRRLNLAPRYGRHGSNVSGDRKFPERKITVRFDSAHGIGDEVDFILRMNTLHLFLHPSNAPFYIEDLSNTIRCRVEPQSLKHVPQSEGLNMILENCELNFSMIDAIWEDTAETEDINAGLVTGDTIIINCTGAEDCFPIIEITANANLGEFRIQNESNETGLTLTPEGFTTGETIIMDSQRGTVEQNDVDISNAILSGGFLILSPGSNTIRYTSADGGCDLTIKYRNASAYP